MAKLTINYWSGGTDSNPVSGKMNGNDLTEGQKKGDELILTQSGNFNQKFNENYGLANCNNSDYLNLSRYGYYIIDKKEWRIKNDNSKVCSQDDEINTNDIARSFGIIDYTKDITIDIEPNWIKIGRVAIFRDGAWKKATPYIFRDGAWKKATPYIFRDGAWKKCI